MDEKLNDDSSHYEISLTATQAFIAFVLLLLSLAAAFVFGIMIGRGQLDAELARRAQQTQATEITEKPMPAPAPDTAPPTATASGKKAPEEPFVIQPAATNTAAPQTTTSGTPSAPQARPPAPAPAPAAKPEPPKPEPAKPATEAATGPAFAQLLATSDAKRAEALAARLIDAGFTTAYVDRIKSDKGTIHRVRVRFKTEADARAALPKLQQFATEKVIVTKQ